MENNNIEIINVCYLLRRDYNKHCRYNVPDKGCYRIMFVKKGSAKLKFKNETVSIAANQALFILPDESYTLTAEGEDDWSFFAIGFNAENVPDNIPRKTVFQTDITQDMFERALIADKNNTEAFPYLAKSIVYSLIYELFKSGSHEAKSGNEVILKTEKYISENYQRKITLSQLASASGYSVSYYKALFTKLYGMSPIRFLNNYRVEKAKSLLKSGMYSVGEVAAECGFENQYYFSNVFHKITGIRPIKYK